MKSSMRWPFAVLCGVPFVMVLSNSLLIPVLPLMQTAMDLNAFQSGLIITAFSVPAGLTIPIAGYLSDRYGRKVIIAPALVVFALGGLFAGLAAAFVQNPFPLLLAGRIVQGIGGGATYQLAMALTGDIFQSAERAKALGLLESANGLGKVISPILGSLTALVIWFAPFFLYPLLAIPVAVGVWLVVKEPSMERQKQPVGEYIQKVGQIFKKNALSLAAAFVAGLIVLFMLFGMLAYLSDVLEQDYNIQALLRGFVIAIPVLGMAITSYLSGSWLQKQAGQICKWATLSGMGLLTAGIIWAAFTTNLVPFMIAVTMIGIGAGLTLPAINLLITGAADQQERGMVTALYGTTRFFGAALGPPAFGLLVEASRTALFTVSAAATLSAGILAFTCIKVPGVSGKTGGSGGSKQQNKKKREAPKQPQRKPTPLR